MTLICAGDLTIFPSTEGKSVIVDGRLNALFEGDRISGQFGVCHHGGNRTFHPDLDNAVGQPIFQIFAAADGVIEITQEVACGDSVFNEGFRTEFLAVDLREGEFFFDGGEVNLAFVAELAFDIIKLQTGNVFFAGQTAGADSVAVVEGFQCTDTSATGIAGNGTVVFNHLLYGVIREIVVAVEDKEEGALGHTDTAVDRSMLAPIGLALIGD